MKINKIHLDELSDNFNSYELVKSNEVGINNTKVYTDNNLYYKIWPSDWGKSNVVKVAVGNGFYDSYTAPVLESLIYDDDGQRGYITKKGKSLLGRKGSDWSKVVENTTIQHRKDFMMYLLEKSLDTRGIHVDLCPNNLVLYNDKLSLIDLDSYTSFSFVFDGETKWFENFNIKDFRKDPLEIVRYDLDLLYNDYLQGCLDIKYGRKINSEQRLIELMNFIERKI